jgi:hypothetical protein
VVTNREIIKACQRQGDSENDEAYEGRISLGPPYHVAYAVEREDIQAKYSSGTFCATAISDCHDHRLPWPLIAAFVC